MDTNLNKIQNEKLFNVLVIEDDSLLEEFWKSIFNKNKNKLKITYAHSESEAEKMILESQSEKTAYDLIIGDVFDGEEKTSIDLYRQLPKSMQNKFIITSSMEHRDFFRVFAKNNSRPIYLQKPLSKLECFGVINDYVH